MADLDASREGGSGPAPVEIGRANVHDVRIRWSDGHESILLARDLRLACPCAMCVDEVSGAARLDPRSVPAAVHPVSISPIGRYAVRIAFSDGHDSGLFTYERLRALCLCPACSENRRRAE